MDLFENEYHCSPIKDIAKRIQVASHELRIFLFISKTSLRAYLADGQFRELNLSHADPIRLLIEKDLNEQLDLEELLQGLCQYAPVHHLFYGFEESPSPSTVELRRNIRKVFKEGHKLSYDFMRFKISKYYVALAQRFRVTNGYTRGVQDNGLALSWYREGLKWWPHAQALIGAAYLVLFAEHMLRNREEGLAYLSEILNVNQQLKKFTSEYQIAYYQQLAKEYSEQVPSFDK